MPPNLRKKMPDRGRSGKGEKTRLANFLTPLLHTATQKSSPHSVFASRLATLEEKMRDD